VLVAWLVLDAALHTELAHLAERVNKLYCDVSIIIYLPKSTITHSVSHPRPLR
jgi:hypothetical protein